MHDYLNHWQHFYRRSSGSRSMESLQDAAALGVGVAIALFAGCW